MSGLGAQLVRARLIVKNEGHLRDAGVKQNHRKRRSLRASDSGDARSDRDGGGGGADLWAHGYGRAAMERMMRIHRKIEDREYPNCTKMSAEFEMSVRTLKRDIEFMRDGSKC
jgi:hypothetical protein